MYARAKIYILSPRIRTSFDENDILATAHKAHKVFDNFQNKINCCRGNKDKHTSGKSNFCR